VRLDIRRIETITTGSEAVGIRCRVKVVKNKVAAPFRVAEFDVMYGSGISREGGLLDVGVAMEVVRKTGAWFNYGDTRLGQGREQSKEFLRTNPDITQRLETEIRARVATVDVPVEGIKEAE
jgi:recombination protein RecA